MDGHGELSACEKQVLSRPLQHREEPREFHGVLPGRVLMGLEACGETQRFEQLLGKMERR
jgi:hypothetical protein